MSTGIGQEAESILRLWAGKITDIMGEVHYLRTKRRMFTTWATMVTDHPVLRRYPHDFLNFIGRSHAADVVAAIRRQCGDGKNERSLLRLLLAVRGVAAEITFDTWLSLGSRSEPPSELARRDFLWGFAREFGSTESPEQLCIRRVQADITLLAKTCGPVAQYATHTVAHSLEDEVPAPVWAQVDAAVTVLDDLSRRYFLLLTCGSLYGHFAEPDPDWASIFDVPWARPNAKPDAAGSGAGVAE